MLLYSLLLSAVPVLMIGLLSSWITSSVVQEESDRSQQTILKQLTFQVDDFLLDLENTSVRLANDQTIKKSLEAGIFQNQLPITMEMMDLLLNAISNTSFGLDISLYYNQYSQIYSSRNGIIRTVEYPYTDIIRQANQLRYGSVVIPPNTYSEMKEMLLVRAIPLNSSNPLGFLIMHLDTLKMKRYLDRISMEGGRKVFIVDDQGTILSSQNNVEPGSKLSPPELLSSIEERAGSADVTVTFDQQEYQVASLRSNVKNWTFVAMTPTDELEAASNKVLLLTWSFVCCLLLASVGASIIGFRKVYRPIQTLASKFDLNPRGDDELQQIDASLVKMTDRNSQLLTKLHEQLPYLKDSLFLQLLRGEVTSREIEMLQLEHKFPSDHSCFSVVVMEIRQSAYERSTYKEEDRVSLLYAMRSVIDEFLQPLQGLYASVVPKSRQIVVLVQTEEPGQGELARLTAVGEQIRERLAGLNVETGIAISSSRPSYATIAESYDEAIRFTDYLWVLGSHSIVHAESLKHSDKQPIHKLAKRKKAILNSLSQNKLDEAREELNAIMAELPASIHQSEAIMGLFSLLIGEIGLLTKERGFDLDNMFEYDVLDYLFGLSSLEEVHSWIAEEVFPKVGNCLDQQYIEHSEKLIPQVLHYIQNNFDSDLSLQNLSGLFGVSASTLSRLFKEETDTNYLEFIIAYRMDRAQVWLSTTDMPIKDIADRLHYTSVQNFTRIFKQVTGTTPGSYRKHKRSQEQTP